MNRQEIEAMEFEGWPIPSNFEHWEAFHPKDRWINPHEFYLLHRDAMLATCARNQLLRDNLTAHFSEEVYIKCVNWARSPEYTEDIYRRLGRKQPDRPSAHGDGHAVDLSARFKASGKSVPPGVVARHMEACGFRRVFLVKESGVPVACHGDNENRTEAAL